MNELKRSEPKVLGKSFYARGTDRVAKELLGKILVVGKTSGRIVETEAYHGDDPAAHFARGKTPRSAIMFGEPGVAYVYFIYGMYEMLNFVTEKKGCPGAVLIRALEPVSGEITMKKRRNQLPQSQWTSGPGRLCRALGIRMKDNGRSLQGPRITVVDDGFHPQKICRTSRVGISKGLEHDWRFFIAENPYVSKSPLNQGAKAVS